MCAISFACAKAMRASICRRACCVKKLLSLGSAGGPKANVAGRSAVEQGKIVMDCSIYQTVEPIHLVRLDPSQI